MSRCITSLYVTPSADPNVAGEWHVCFVADADAARDPAIGVVLESALHHRVMRQQLLTLETTLTADGVTLHCNTCRASLTLKTGNVITSLRRCSAAGARAPTQPPVAFAAAVTLCKNKPACMAGLAALLREHVDTTWPQLAPQLLRKERVCSFCHANERRMPAPLPEKKKFDACGYCPDVWYCSLMCQRADWKEHRRLCKRNNAIV